ncbi:hypothetical protein QYM36_007773 [Artemia franciscana]|uniref:Uncharacterized protein n=1 Tax=Artemia franciscana TaxID=6661 RepID=A0AA88IGV3_ARTSF|nr:hypothetical protein QYM36_007773 [Artemia franciscana]
MVIYPMREHDYDLVDDVNGQEIKSIFKNLKSGTAADDIAFVANKPEDMQTLLNLMEEYLLNLNSLI